MALEQASRLRKQIDERKKEAAGNSEVLGTLQELGKNVAAAMETDSDAGFGLFGIAPPGREHESLSEVSAALTGLLITVESSDLGPASDAAGASAQWEVSARDTLARWTTFQKEDVAGVNALLEKAKLKRLAVEESPAPR
jgi:hypothetical protein